MQCNTNDTISQVIYTPAVCCITMMISLSRCDTWLITIHHLVVAQGTAPHRPDLCKQALPMSS